MKELIGYFFVVFFISFIIFLILRELNCWYWKINEIVTLLNNIQGNLQKLASAQEGESGTPGLPPDKEICPFCKEPSLKANIKCEVCGKEKPLFGV